MVQQVDNAEERPLSDGRGSDPPTAVQSTEWVLVAVLVLTGTVLRCWQPGHLAVEHFDEGVYASNLYSPDGAYPFRHLYSPPLLPALLEWALILSGGAAGSVMAVNVIAGSAMIPSLWWVGRQWFGPLAGLTAATLATLSSVHILYSRTALTDVLQCLWMLWGAYWAWRAILTGRPTLILLAAMFASLALWTKYNGWLTLAVSGAGTAAWLIFNRRAGEGTSPIRSVNSTPSKTGNANGACTNRGADVPRSPVAIFRWTTIASITLAAWISNVRTDLQDHGGYAAVAANHARYFVGLEGWWGGLLRQWTYLTFIESAGGSLALAVAGLVLVGASRCEVTVRPQAAAGIIVIAAVLLAINLVAPVTVLVLLAAVGIGRELVRDWRNGHHDGRSLASWMLAAWFMGLLVAIPLYTPYPRLTLPLIVAIWLGVGLAVNILPGACRTMSGSMPDEVRPRPWHLGLACVMLIAAGPLCLWQDEFALQDRRSLQVIAREIARRLPEDEPVIVQVLGEPGLFFHLANQSQNPNRLILPGGDFETLSPPDPAVGPVAMYVIYGPHVMRMTDDPVAGISWPEANLTAVAEWDYRPSTLVLLNEYPPDALKAGGVEPFVIRLSRIGE